jgi:tetratricopeptide (TPR) repeat protein
MFWRSRLLEANSSLGEPDKVYNPRSYTTAQRAKIGERLKAACAQSGISLKKLAELIDVHQTVIYQYVRGIVAIPADTMQKIVERTGVTLDFVIGDIEAGPGGSSSETQQDTGTREAETPATAARLKLEMEHLKKLREAQLYPKRNRAGYMSTMEQMLALARATDHKKQEAWILWQIGRMRLDENNIDSAIETILTARRMFTQEGMGEYDDHAAMDLAAAYEQCGRLEEAKRVLQALVSSDLPEIQWRVQVSLGALHYKMHHNEEALECFCNAAEHIENLSENEREHEGLTFLMTAIAEIARAAGHQESAVLLWSQCMQRSTDDRMAGHFLEAIMGIAQPLQDMGKLTEARQRLELAVMLAGFLFDDDSRLSIARGLLADVLVTLGAIDDARDNARLAQKLAYRARGAQPTIISALSLAETSLAVDHWRDALDYSQEALDEAKRTSRTSEVSRARELRSRAMLRGAQSRHAAGDAQGSAEMVNKAIAEAMAALDHAMRADAPKETMAAHLALAKCYAFKGDTSRAETEVQKALQLAEEGSVGLQRLTGNSRRELPELLKSGNLDLSAIFSSRSLYVPGLEWEAHYLNGCLLANRLGPEAAYDSMKQAANLVKQVLMTLPPTEASRYINFHAEVKGIFADLRRFATTDQQQAEVAEITNSMSVSINEAIAASPTLQIGY